MATFTSQQLAGLDAAYTRKLKGMANADDLVNIKYAEQRGWVPAAPVSATSSSDILQTPQNVISSRTSTTPILSATPPVVNQPTETPQVKTTQENQPTQPANVNQPATVNTAKTSANATQPDTINAPVGTTTQQTNQNNLATLQSPDGSQKVVVTVGSNEASQLQSEGWKLGAPSNASVISLDQALGKQNAQPQPSPASPSIDSTQSDGIGFDIMDFLGVNNGDAKQPSDTQTLDVTESPTSKLLEKYGVTPPSKDANPVQDYAETYNQVLSKMGIPSIKVEFEKVQERYASLQNELNDKISEINDDPWLTEGLRVGRIKSMQDKYEGKLRILSDQQKLYNALYEQGIEQAKFVTNAAYNQQQFNTQTAFNIANLALKEQEARESLQSSKLRDKLAIAQEMRLRAAQDAEDKEKTTLNSLNSLKTLADMFGGAVFNNLSSSEKRAWEKNAGLIPGTMDYLGRTIEEQKIAQDFNSISLLKPAQIQSTINQITGAFDNEPIVKNFNAIGEAKKFVDNLGNKTNPTSADDQGLIYAFAKAMDPVSAVREGEYLTVQKYSQSMIQSGWANAQRLAKNVAFLTPEARKNMVATVNSKFQAAQSGYNNLYSEYNRRIEEAKSGVIGGSLPNYGQAWENSSNLPVLDKSYNSLDSLVEDHPEYKLYIIQQAQQGKDEAAILKDLGSGKPITFSSGMGGTPTAQKIAMAIRQVESGGDYSASGASGEQGAYQFMPSTWASLAGKYLGNSKAPLTKKNQDKVAQLRIQSLLDKGYDAKSIALIWNGGTPTVKRGINKYGVAYDSGAYANKVLSQLS